MSERIEIIIMDKPAYTLEEYRCLRKHNREICRYFPEEYGTTHIVTGKQIGRAHV